MNEPQLDVILDRPNPEYAVGEWISGTVRVRAPARVKCRELTVACQSSSNLGRSPRSRRGPEPVVLYRGVWAAGAERDYRFSVKLRGPPTHAGRLVRVRWAVRARADLPGKPSRTAEVPIVVVRDRPQPLRWKPRGSVGDAVKPGFAASISTFIGVLSMAMVFGVAGKGQALFPVIFLVGAVGVVTATRIVREVLGPVRLRVHEVKLETGAEHEGRHAPLDVAVRFTAKSRVEWVKATLSCGGIVRRQSAADDVVFSHVEQLNDGAAPGERETFFSLRPPTDQPMPASSLDASVDWRLELHFAVDNWPDHIYTQRLSLLPADADEG